MIDEVRKKVNLLLNNDNSGHDMNHIDRVLKLSLKFALKEGANIEVVSLIALLHDVDDYKLFGMDNSNKLTNAKKIMNDVKIDKNIQDKVLSEIKSIGYSKCLKGIRPKTLEGMIVSDADMCDALGANGIIRTYSYSIKNGKPFFNKKKFPLQDLNYDNYTKECSSSSVCHIFEKILKLKNLMLTSSGKKEAVERHKIVVDFLYHLFDEEDSLEWKEYLDNYLQIKTTIK